MKNGIRIKAGRRGRGKDGGVQHDLPSTESTPSVFHALYYLKSFHMRGECSWVDMST